MKSLLAVTALGLVFLSQPLLDRSAIAVTEIVANVVANILTNYINHVADTEIDFPKVELASPQAA